MLAGWAHTLSDSKYMWLIQRGGGGAKGAIVSSLDTGTDFVVP